MNFLNFVHHLENFGDTPAFVANGKTQTYKELADRIRSIYAGLTIPRGSVVALVGDLSSETIAWQIALQAHAGIVVPIGPTWRASAAQLIETARTEFVVEANVVRACVTDQDPGHEFYEELRMRGHAGLVVHTSGSTGAPKAVVHDACRLLEKICKPGRAQRTLPFMSFDHVGGQNTMLYCLAHGGCLVIAENRNPETIARTIQDHQVELLPTSPSFLRLLLLSGAIEQFDFSSLQLITYGSEPMPESTLSQLNEKLPNVAKMQQFGMSEVGVLRSRSRDDNSTWIKLGGPEFETRIVGGLLEIKAETAMLGYLNAASPFTADGWLKTGDLAEQDGEWVRILGRRSEVINVGGEKVNPAEVENVIEQMEGVALAMVRAEANGILGSVVTARVQISTNESAQDFRPRLRTFCQDRMPKYMIPQKIEVVQDAGVILKKKRAA